MPAPNRSVWQLFSVRLLPCGFRARLRSSPGRGSAQHKEHTVALDLLETAYIKAGSALRQFEYLFRETSETLESERSLFTGVKSVSAEDNWSNGGVVVMRSDRAYPATIRSIIASVEGEP